MNVFEIVRDYLISHGYDGLCNEDCGCTLDYLIPCENRIDTCEPGYLEERDGERGVFRVEKAREVQ